MRSHFYEKLEEIDMWFLLFSKAELEAHLSLILEYMWNPRQFNLFAPLFLFLKKKNGDHTENIDLHGYSQE